LHLREYTGSYIFDQFAAATPSPRTRIRGPDWISGATGILLSLNDGQDACPTEEEISPGLCSQRPLIMPDRKGTYD
jgi:hypothetical protein